MKKIIFFNHNYENFGTYFRCFFLGKYLARMGYEVDLVCASKKEFDLTIKKRRIEDRFNVITLPRVKFHEYHTGHTIRGVLNSLIVLIKQYDIIHTFAVAQPSTAMPSVLAYFKDKKKLYVDWDDAWGGGFSEYHPSLVGRVITSLEKNVPKLAKKVTVVSEFLKEKSIEYKYNENDIVKIPNGANITDINPIDKGDARKYLNIKEDEEILLSMGHTYMESMDYQLDAFRKLIKKRPGTKLYIVGNIGSAIKKVKENFSDIFNSLVFTGEQPFSKIPYYLSAADALVLPMEDSPIEKARFPIRLGDYMASGKPIISNAVGEIKYVLETEECGLTCEPCDIDDFSNIMLKILDDKALQKKLGTNARNAAENKYSWEKITMELSKLYESN